MAEIIGAAGLTKVYGTTQKTHALRGVDFSVEKNEFISIIGQSGSGKSTLLNLLGLLDRQTAGSLQIVGADVSALSKKERADFRNRHLGFVFQFHHLIPEFTVIENLLVPGWIAGDKDREARCAKAMEMLEVLDLGAIADKDSNDLSGGQKQRVAIGRALMNSPDLVLADEPTGNLDTKNTEQIYALFRRIHREWSTTFVIVTHDRAIAEQTDRIIEIRDGRVVQDVRNEYLTTSAPH